MKKVKSNYKVGDIIIHKPSKTVYCIHEITTWTKRGDTMCNTLCTTLGAGMKGGQFYADDTNLCLVSEFFSQNVVIPRGENRHPYADIIHAKAENINLDIQFREKYDEKDFHHTSFPAWDINAEYRIKPSEPVYEWKYSFSTYGHKLTTDNFMTDEEARKYQLPLIFSKIEETKRVRQ